MIVFFPLEFVVERNEKLTGKQFARRNPKRMLCIGETTTGKSNYWMESFFRRETQ